MAYTQAQLDSLEAAIAEGARTVKYEDREVTYRSLKDMESLRRRMRLELGLVERKPVRVYAQHRKGL